MSSTTSSTSSCISTGSSTEPCPTGCPLPIWDWPLQQGNECVRVHNDDTQFMVSLPMATFTSNEIQSSASNVPLPNETVVPVQVKVCRGELVVSCARGHSETSQGRHVYRAYRLPVDVDARTVRSRLTAKGTLVITAQKKAA